MIAAVFIFAGWMLVGSVVVECCRIWRAWWVSPLDLSYVLFWPVVLFLTIKNGADQ